jgi:hypothetical protein
VSGFQHVGEHLHTDCTNLTARVASSSAPADVLGNEAMKAGKRSGYFRTSSAMPSLASFAMSVDTGGGPNTSIGGEPRQITCA